LRDVIRFGNNARLVLRTYSEYIVGNAAGLMAPKPNAA